MPWRITARRKPCTLRRYPVFSPAIKRPKLATSTMSRKTTDGQQDEVSRAYARVLETLGIAIEVSFDYEPHLEYVAAANGTLWHAEQQGEPKEIGSEAFEEFLQQGLCYVVPTTELHEFKEVLPDDATWY